MELESIEDSRESFFGSLNQAFSASATWNGRQIQQLNNLVQTVSSGAGKIGSFIIGNQQIGYCLQGHPAYHKYLQDNYPPIFLCDAAASKCCFELHRFAKFVNTGSYE